MSERPWDHLGPQIGQRVRALREHRGLTVARLARDMGCLHCNSTPEACILHIGIFFGGEDCKAVWLQHLEEGRLRDLMLSDLCRLAHALRCKPATLLPERLPALPRKRAARARQRGAPSTE
jgi:transcriptional regulator with XRE-family HTH domain